MKIKLIVSFWNGQNTENKVVEIIDNQTKKEKKQAGNRSRYLAEKIKEQIGYNHSSFSQI